jgi:hypothetical protein
MRDVIPPLMASGLSGFGLNYENGKFRDGQALDLWKATDEDHGLRLSMGRAKIINEAIAKATIEGAWDLANPAHRALFLQKAQYEEQARDLLKGKYTRAIAERNSMQPGSAEWTRAHANVESMANQVREMGAGAPSMTSPATMGILPGAFPAKSLLKLPP